MHIEDSSDTVMTFRKDRRPDDIGRTTLIAFATRRSYRRRFEAWLRGREWRCRSASW